MSVLHQALSAFPPLLLAAGLALGAALVGAILARWLPGTGRVIHGAAQFVLMAVLVLAGLRYVRLDPALDALLPRFGMPTEQIVGGETRVPLSSDGHFWIEASVNGAAQRFMVDTGATVSALSHDAALAAAIRPDPLRLPVLVRTANGTTSAQLARVGDLRLGNVVARDLDVIVTSEGGGLNVLGMNFLSRLKGWRVEDGVLILSPRTAS